MCFLKKFHLKWYFRIFFWTLVDNWLVVATQRFLMFIPVWENVTNLTSIFFSNQLVIASISGGSGNHGGIGIHYAIPQRRQGRFAWFFLAGKILPIGWLYATKPTLYCWSWKIPEYMRPRYVRTPHVVRSWLQRSGFVVVSGSIPFTLLYP